MRIDSQNENANVIEYRITFSLDAATVISLFVIMAGVYNIHTHTLPIHAILVTRKT